jgi:hypothetical protein
MVTNSKTIMKKNSLMNPITQLWAKYSYVIFKHKLLEFIKLAKITCIQVFKFVEDEHYFLIVAFIKNKLKNCFTCYLDMCT